MDTVQKQADELRKQWAESDRKRDEGVSPAEVREIGGIPYANGCCTDIFYPEQAADSYPVIVNVHGGGWFYGDRQLYSLYAKYLASHGFAVVSFDYRLAPEHRYPAGFLDVCALMDFVQTHAAEYGLDLSALCMVGDSAGAQLVSQYCVYASNPEYRALLPETAGLAAPLPQRIALNCGLYALDPHTDGLLRWYADGEIPDSLLHVLDCMKAGFPQTYLMASVNDGLRGRSAAMRERLEALGIPHVYREFGADDPTAGHVFHLDMRSETGQRCNAEEIAFFRGADKTWRRFI